MGNYCPSNGMIIPTICPNGTYCPTTGIINPTLCMSGYYCPDPYKQLLCTAGNYCPSGSFIQTQCKNGYYCPTPLEELPCPSTNYCPPGSIIPSILATYTISNPTGNISQLKTVAITATNGQNTTNFSYSFTYNGTSTTLSNTTYTGDIKNNNISYLPISGNNNITTTQDYNSSIGYVSISSNTNTCSVNLIITTLQISTINTTGNILCTITDKNTNQNIIMTIPITFKVVANVLTIDNANHNLRFTPNDNELVVYLFNTGTNILTFVIDYLNSQNSVIFNSGEINNFQPYSYFNAASYINGGFLDLSKGFPYFSYNVRGFKIRYLNGSTLI